MKRFLRISALLLLFSCLSSGLFAQLPLIQSLFIIPANPTTFDTVKVVAQTVFSSGDCLLTSSSVSNNSGIIDAYAIHTLGMLTYICSSTDTLTLGKLESGTYKLRYHLSCAPYPAGTDLDSIIFTVQVYTGLDRIENVPHFTLFPNPAQNIVTIQFPDFISSAEIFVYDVQGREQLRHQTSESQTDVDITNLAKGVYIIRVSSDANNGFQKLIKL